MGLCKCPKRQVTNQFCFEHRVNVCEHCMVQNHPKCIVQSYLQWLRDSDYVSSCSLCSTPLENAECVRLVCYHVFHWNCLNTRQAALPANTAPGGHTCPTCGTEIFPISNLVSPVVDALKNFLVQANWGRSGIGMDLLSEDTANSSIQGELIMGTSKNSVTKIHAASMERTKADGIFGSNSSHSVLLMDTFNPPSQNDLHASSRRQLLPRQSPIGGSDHDENKYKRRTPAEIFSRWSRRFYAPSSRPPWRRTWFLVCSGVLTFVFLVYLMAFFGRGGNSGNLLDDEWNNPNPKSQDHY